MIRTLAPTLSPTFTMPPTVTATVSTPPSAVPSLPEPSKSPTLTPTLGPVCWALTHSFLLFCLPEIVKFDTYCFQMYAPMPSLMASFFCGIDWNNAIRNCKWRCPTGEVCSLSIVARSMCCFFSRHLITHHYLVSPQSALLMKNVLALRHARRN